MQETCSREQEGWEAESREINCIWIIRENWSEKQQQASGIDVSLCSGARDFELKDSGAAEGPSPSHLLPSFASPHFLSARQSACVPACHWLPGALMALHTHHPDYSSCWGNHMAAVSLLLLLHQARSDADQVFSTGTSRVCLVSHMVSVRG